MARPSMLRRTIVTVGWIVEGADTLTLTLRVKDAASTLASWTREQGADLPAEYRMAVLESARLILTAADQQGNRSMKSLRLDVKQRAANG